MSGYLRSYAQLLKLPIDAVLIKNLRQMTRNESESNRQVMTNVVKPKIGNKADFFGYVVIAVFVLLALLWWRTTRVHTDVTPAAAAINNTMTALQLPSTESQPPTNSQQVVLPQVEDNNLKAVPQSNTAKIE